jgi:hypothetical protein
VSLPAGNVEEVTVAAPFVTVDVPRTVVPFVKVTFPVTLVGSFAVKVTDWLKVDGFTEEVRVSAGEAFDTVCVTVPVAELFVASPP